MNLQVERASSAKDLNQSNPYVREQLLSFVKGMVVNYSQLSPIRV